METQGPRLWISVSVSDTGKGMDAETRRTAFKMFGNYKVKNDINQGGMGLGLSVSKMICKSLKGKLTIIRTSTEENQGTKINFMLPITLGSPFSEEEYKKSSDPIQKLS